MLNIEETRYFTLAMIAKRWCVDKKTVATLVEMGELEAFRAGVKAIRVRVDVLEAYEREKGLVAR